MTNKRLDIELMRFFACFFVVFNHTQARGFFRFSTFESTRLLYDLGLCLSIFCKFAVPLFLAVSGALLLGRNESYRMVWKKRILKIFIILFVWSFLYHLYNNRFNEFDLVTLVKSFFQPFFADDITFHLWYLYAFIGFLISLPLLRKIARSLSRKDYVYLFSIYFLMHCIMPVAEYLSSIPVNSDVRIPWIGVDIFIFPLLGYFLSNLPNDFWNWKRLAALWAVNIVCIVISAELTTYNAELTGVLNEAVSQEFHKTFVITNCAAVFVSCQYLVNRISIPKRLEKCIRSLGGASFGIYLIHPFIVGSSAYYIYWNMLLSLNLFPYIDTFIFCVTIFLISYILTIIIKRIPVIRKLVS